MEPPLFMASYHLMEIFGWESFTSPWSKGDCACYLVPLRGCISLVDGALVLGVYGFTQCLD
jgi:hypothetical protein